MDSELTKILRDFSKQNGIEYMAVFGSFARGQATENSDIDILVRFEKPIGLLALIDLETKLSNLMNRKIDLVTVNELSPYIRDKVLEEAVAVYEAA